MQIFQDQAIETIALLCSDLFQRKSNKAFPFKLTTPSLAGMLEVQSICTLCFGLNFFEIFSNKLLKWGNVNGDRFTSFSDFAIIRF
mmetsp:Transcript_12532/g.18252  ORF Transcript_12532/g.18252 Transcript_12532/m.18252 type:complete len:86 (-) Transcript_12532:124-381(-)